MILARPTPDALAAFRELLSRGWPDRARMALEAVESAPGIPPAWAQEYRAPVPEAEREAVRAERRGGRHGAA